MNAPVIDKARILDAVRDVTAITPNRPELALTMLAAAYTAPLRLDVRPVLWLQGDGAVMHRLKDIVRHSQRGTLSMGTRYNDLCDVHRFTSRASGVIVMDDERETEDGPGTTLILRAMQLSTGTGQNRPLLVVRSPYSPPETLPGVEVVHLVVAPEDLDASAYDRWFRRYALEDGPLDDFANAYAAAVASNAENLAAERDAIPLPALVQGLSTFDAFTESYAGVRFEQRELFELIDLVWPGEDDPELPYA
ncbi:MAG TPA: hypothetical protein VK039_11160 [Brevibacterium sp.]|nr:hypothetical protein [Brevibacterium sp.]